MSSKECLRQVKNSLELSAEFRKKSKGYFIRPLQEILFLKNFFSQVESEIQVESSLFFGSGNQVESSLYFGSGIPVESSLYFGSGIQVESSLHFGSGIQVESSPYFGSETT